MKYNAIYRLLHRKLLIAVHLSLCTSVRLSVCLPWSSLFCFFVWERSKT